MFENPDTTVILIKSSLVPYNGNSIIKQAILWALLLVSVGSVSGDTRTSTTDGFKPSALTSNAPEVNPYNGDLNFGVPLASIGGRGEAGYSVFLPIRQNWALQTTVIANNASISPFYEWFQNGNPVPITAPIDSRSYLPGFIYGRKVGIPLYCGTNYESTFTSLTVILPDGTRKTFIDQATEGQPLGGQTACGGGPGAGRGTVFKTNDGSAMTFISDTDIIDAGGNSFVAENGFEEFYPSGFLLFPNGTRYRFDGGYVSWITDRNGNKVSFVYETFIYNYKRVTSAVDAIGRTVNISYGSSEDQITYLGTGGAARTVRVLKANLSSSLRTGEILKQYGGSGGLFPELGGAGQWFNPVLVNEIVLPDNRSYKLRYNSYGELARIEYPTGGATEYDWQAGVNNGNTSGSLSFNSSGSLNYNGVYRRVVENRLYADGTNLSNKRTFSRPETQTSPGSYTNIGYVQVDEFDGSNNRVAASKSYYHGSPAYSLSPSNLRWTPWQEGKGFKTEYLDLDGSTVIKRVEHTWHQRAPNAWGAFEGGLAPPIDPRITDTTTTLVDSGQVSKNEFAYDNFNNLTDVYEYDYAAGAPGALIKRTHTDYVTDSNYTSHTGSHLRSLRSQMWISSDSAGSSKKSLIVYEYDNYVATWPHATLEPRANVTGHDSIYGTGFGYRGNLTATTSYANAQTQTESTTSYAQYDILGNVTKTIDARGYATEIYYQDRFGSPDNEAQSNNPSSQLGGFSTFAFPTSGKNALNMIVGYSQFDYFTGLVVNNEDLNGIVSKTTYNDPLDRPRQTVRAIGTSAVNQSTIDYYDATSRVETSSDLTNFGDNLLKSETRYDGIGRETESRGYEPGGYVAITSVPFEGAQDPENLIWRPASKSSNPYRPLNGEQPAWNKSLTDSLGRVAKVLAPDGSFAKTEYFGDKVLVTDQAGNKRLSQIDALGRLKYVWEIVSTPNQWTESVLFSSQSFHAYKTAYAYDALGNLINVQQGTQQVARTFNYNGLSRLTSVSNPESGTTSYQYDANGNLEVKTDSRGVSTHYEYDALNRIKRRWHNGSSLPSSTIHNSPPLPPGVALSFEAIYYYDQALVANSKGRLWRTTMGYKPTGKYRVVQENIYENYDAMGRPQLFRQLIGDFAVGYYDVSYVYNLAGMVTALTYPSGRSVNYNYDTAGRLASMNGNLGDGVLRTYADSFQYTAFGGIQQERFGTTTPLYHKKRFNSRGQLWDVRLSTQPFNPYVNQDDGDRGAIVNHYSTNYLPGSSGADNNGDVVRQEIKVPGADVYQQDYTYDSLNRLKMVIERQNGINISFYQTYSYDRYGNRAIDPANTYNAPSPQFDNNKMEIANRLYAFGEDPELPCASPTSTTRLMCYDSAGNMIRDKHVTNAAWIAYDADGKMTRHDVDDAQTAPTQYFYDSDGKRRHSLPSVGKAVDFIYGLGGELLAEGRDAMLTKEYVYRNGDLLLTATVKVTDSDIRWLVKDHLGTPRIIANKTGDLSAIKRHDYLPFGEEISPPVGGRSSSQGYGNSPSDGVRQKFTGYERDSQTGLDYAEARYFGSSIGRFTSVDPVLFESRRLFDPQQINLYSYVRNSPLLLTDPTGMLLTDFINQETGERTMIEDGKDQVILATGKQIKWFKTAYDKGRSGYFDSLRKFENSRNNLHLTRDEFVKLVSAVYVESSGGVGETQGIVDVLQNRASNEGTSLMEQVTDEAPRGVYGVRKNNYGTDSGPLARRKKLDVQLGVALGVTQDDITNGATSWDGVDFNGRANLTGGYQARYAKGYLFTDPSHDLWKQGSRMVNGTYMFKSTAAIGKTTFSRLFNEGSKWYLPRR
jgi:RHS repeat-associated protein